MSKSLAAYAIKPKGMDSGVREIIERLFIGKENDYIDRILLNYDKDRADQLRKVIKKTDIVAEIKSHSPKPGTKDWIDSFWDFNYSHLKDEYYYDNYITHMKGDFSVIFLESTIGSEILLELLADLKGRTTFVKDVNLGKEDDNVISLGKGIRGEFTTEAVMLTDEIIEHLVEVLSPSGDMLSYLLESRGKNLMYPKVDRQYKGIFYRALPKKYQDNLNSHRIHSIDDLKTLKKSLKWLAKRGNMYPKYDIDINNLISRINGK